MKITQMFDENGNVLATDIWISKKGNFRYINVDMFQKGQSICPLCQEKHSLKAHHVIPKRLKIDYFPLKELRIKICNDCHNKIHPESVLILAIKKLIKVINDLTDGNADSIETVKEFREIVYNSKSEEGISYNHLEKINENLRRQE